MNVGLFLFLAFGISLAAFAGVALVPGARSPESGRGLPFWLLMVWGPTLAALIVASRADGVGGLVSRAVQVSTVPAAVWLLIALPLLLLAVLPAPSVDAVEPIGAKTLAAMTAFNLILGPLGEELGWRGVLHTEFEATIGWLAASLAVGVIWLAWHLPLWLIDTPHAEIPLHLFAGHCMAYSVIIGSAHHLSEGSVLPAILLHLAFNLASNIAAFRGFDQPDSWFRASLPGYGLLAAGTAAFTAFTSGSF